jgi:hypothetical protein
MAMMLKYRATECIDLRLVPHLCISSPLDGDDVKGILNFDSLANFIDDDVGAY